MLTPSRWKWLSKEIWSCSSARSTFDIEIHPLAHQAGRLRLAEDYCELRRIGRGAEKLTTETNGADESNIYHVVMAETDSTEIDSILRWDSERFMPQNRRCEVYTLLVSLCDGVRKRQQT